MPEISIDIEVWCSCGEGLCGQSETKTTRWGSGIVVSPCQKCMDAQYENGVDDGVLQEQQNQS